MPAPQVPVTNDEFDINKVNEALAENYDNIEDHKSDAANPHGVTAAQIGAALDSDVQGILAVDVVRPGEDPTSFSADLTGDPAQRAVISASCGSGMTCRSSASSDISHTACGVVVVSERKAFA